MTEHDAMTLLAEANPVRVEDLASLDLPDRVHGRRPSRRFVLAAAVAAAAVTASLIGVFAFGGSPHAREGIRSAGPLATLAHPLTHPDAREVTLIDARRALGAPIVLPNSALAGPSDVGAIWTQSEGPVTDVAVTFPGPAVIVGYSRPVEYPEVPAAMYATEAKQSPHSMSTISLDGVPALATAQNSDQLHQNFGSIEFVIDGTQVMVLGHYDEATLQSVAQSIVDHSKPALVPAVPPAIQPLADASKILGAPVVLPDTTLVSPSDADKTVETACVPKDDTSEASGPGCQVRVNFASAGVTVTYLRWAVMQSLQTSYDQIAQHNSGAALLSLNGGVQALWVPQEQESWMEFELNGTQVVVQGSYDEATLQALAQSIVDRSQ